jgi:drug/metabolite transporter (DMT)-like permease
MGRQPPFVVARSRMGDILKAELLVLFPVSIACDVAGQVLFKRGADRLAVAGNDGAASFARGLVLEPWLMAGVATFAVETFIWLRILSETPLSIAFPIASLNFIGVTLAGRVLFGEYVSTAQWLGCLLVTTGVAVLSVASPT